MILRPKTKKAKVRPFNEEPKKTCVEKAMTAWGYFFDFFTIAINITDIVSDILVALQFYHDDHMTWFWLVLGSLILSNCVFTIVYIEVTVRTGLQMTSWPRPIQYFLFFPFAQLAPIMNWVLSCWGETKLVDDDEVGRMPIPDPNDHPWEDETRVGGVASRVVMEETSDLREEVKILRSFEQALAQHMKSHLLFYVETLAESIPQSVIQLLAITFLGQASSLQVFSMSLSLISIVSKGYVLSKSLNIKIMIYKFMLAAYDLFSLFYLFASIMSQDRANEVEFGGTHMTWITYIWIIRVFVLAVGGVIFVLSLLLRAVRIRLSIAMNGYGPYRYPNLGDIKDFFGLVGFSILVTGPALLALEGAKLVWIAFFIKSHEPQHREHLPVYKMIRSFVKHGNRNERMRFISLQALEAHIKSLIPTRHGVPVYLLGRSFIKRDIPEYDLSTSESDNAENDADDGDVVDAGDIRDISGSVISISSYEEEMRKRADSAEAYGIQDELTSEQRRDAWLRKRHPYDWRLYHLLTDDPTSFKARYLAMLPPRWTWTKPGFITWPEIIYNFFFSTIYTIGQFYSGFYPYISYIMYFHSQNLLQHFCFIAMGVSLLVVMALTPYAYDYVSFMMEMNPAIKSWLGTTWRQTDRMNAIRRWIASYHIPSMAHILHYHIPKGLLPFDIVELVSGMMPVTGGVNLQDLTIAKCEEIKSSLEEQDAIVAAAEELEIMVS